MRRKVSCEYLLNNGICLAINQSEKAKTVRDEQCVNAHRNACCCLCIYTEQCEISCVYLIQAEDLKLKKPIEKEIEQYKKAIEKLSIYFAEGKVTEQSYLISISKLEKHMKELNLRKERLLSHGVTTYGLRCEANSVKRPAFWWYLVSLFFGRIGDLFGYLERKVARKDRYLFLAYYLFILALGLSLGKHFSTSIKIESLDIFLEFAALYCLGMHVGHDERLLLRDIILLCMVSFFPIVLLSIIVGHRSHLDVFFFPSALILAHLAGFISTRLVSIPKGSSKKTF